MNENEIKKSKDEINSEIEEILKELEDVIPGITEGLATALGATLGGAFSLSVLSAIGSVSGLSAAGVTSGLAAAGLGAGMVAGIGVLALPIAGLAVGGYAIAKRRKQAKQLTALSKAIEKLNNLIDRLHPNAEFFSNEIVEIRAIIKHLIHKKQKI